MINWKNPEEILPEKDKLVWVLYQHNKEHKYRSTQIMCGEVQYSNDGTSCIIDSNDFTGCGSWAVTLKNTREEYIYGDKGLAWCYVNELNIPEWTPHNSWWDK